MRDKVSLPIAPTVKEARDGQGQVLIKDIPYLLSAHTILELHAKKHAKQGDARKPNQGPVK